jgi:PleD family two-component response regulator
MNRLEQAAQTDELTGAANRRHFMALAARELARALRCATPLSLLMPRYFQKHQ